MKTRRVFTASDTKSNDGMLTTVWGPSLWHVLHTMSFNYPIHPTKDQKGYFRDFVLNLVHVLPCKYCRENLIKNFKTLPLTYSEMENRNTFSRYIYNLHETVNKMLNKPSTLSYCDVRERYEHFRARCNVTTQVEKGCTEPLVGKKSKGVIIIIPQDEPCGETIQIDKQCLKSRIHL